MKKLLLSAGLVLIAATSCATAQRMTLKGTGKTVSFELQLTDFNGLAVSNNINVEVAQSDKYSVMVTTDEAAEDYLDFILSKGQLKIGYSSNVRMVQNINTTVYITMPELESVSLSSGATLKNIGILSGKSLTLNASSQGTAELNAKYSQLTASSSSSGRIVFSGKANIVSVSASSNSSVEFPNLFETEKLTISSSSSSSVIFQDVTAVSITVKASSNGLVTIQKGQANLGTLTASSSARIEAKNLILTTADAKASSSGFINLQVTSSLLASANSSGKIYVFGEPLSINSSTSSSGMVVQKK